MIGHSKLFANISSYGDYLFPEQFSVFRELMERYFNAILFVNFFLTPGNTTVLRHISDYATTCKGTGKRGHILVDTLLPTQMFPRLPARATSVADTNFVSGTQKMFLILVRNILCPQQMFSSLRNMRYIMSNNVSATMCPRLPVPKHVNIESWPSMPRSRATRPRSSEAAAILE